MERVIASHRFDGWTAEDSGNGLQKAQDSQFQKVARISQSRSQTRVQVFNQVGAKLPAGTIGRALTHPGSEVDVSSKGMDTSLVGRKQRRMEASERETTRTSISLLRLTDDSPDRWNKFCSLRGVTLSQVSHSLLIQRISNAIQTHDRQSVSPVNQLQSNEWHDRRAVPLPACQRDATSVAVQLKSAVSLVI